MQRLDLSRELGRAGLRAFRLGELTRDVTPLSPGERRTLVDQALLLMEEVFVHLPLKRAMHAVDPVQRLRLLRHRIDTVDERTFHEEMIATFMSLRDLHTNYILPAPYHNFVAVLPFTIGEYFNGTGRNYLVTGIFDGLVHPSFRVGARITHWNGVPIARAIELHGKRGAGSNPAASYRRGVEQMTQRMLAMSLPPDEEWVELQYETPSGTNAVRIDWLVVASAPDADAGAPLASAADPRLRWMLAQGLDLQTQATNDMKKRLFDVAQVNIEEEVLEFLKKRDRGEESAAADSPDFDTVSTMPDVFTFGTKTTAHGERAYVRIATFMVKDPEAFVGEFVRILGLLPQNGLILDVRSNPGGNMVAGEMLLQTLSPRRIEPCRLHFITSPLMKRLVNGFPDWFAKWAPSMNRALTIGAAFSQALPFYEPETYNRIGRKYPGKVVLLTNAGCYSTTDIFAAGFQDHEIGAILGTDANTGAGGANVFEWDLLRQLFDVFEPGHPFTQLPRGAGFRVAIRATTRVHARAGVPLEDLGVEPDHIHPLTLQDLVENESPLFDRAAELTKS